MPTKRRIESYIPIMNNLRLHLLSNLGFLSEALEGHINLLEADVIIAALETNKVLSELMIDRINELLKD